MSPGESWLASSMERSPHDQKKDGKQLQRGSKIVSQISELEIKQYPTTEKNTIHIIGWLKHHEAADKFLARTASARFQEVSTERLPSRTRKHHSA